MVNINKKIISIVDIKKIIFFYKKEGVKMKKKIIIIIIAIVILLGIFIVSTYNGLVIKEENVLTAESNIATALQRRADLIPNLVNTVKGYS